MTEMEEVQERYLHWKVNTPKLYSHLHTQNTVWPSLQVKFLPDLEHSNVPGISSFRLLTTLNSSGQKDNDFIRISKYTTNDETQEKINLNNYDAALEEFKSENRSSNKFQILQNLKVPTIEGDINCVEYMPQNPDLIGLGCSNGGIYLIDKTKHASNLEMENTSNFKFFDLKLNGSKSEITSLNFNYQSFGKLITSTIDGEIKLFDLNNFRSNEKLIESNKFNGDKNGINSVKWCLNHCSIFLSANESNDFKIFDIRNNNALSSSREFHNGGVNCLSINKLNEFLISTGDSNGVINVWDLRNLEEPILKFDKIHNDSITCLEFNPLKPNVLASGSIDSTVQIYDLNNPEPLTFKHSGHMAGINDISWNLHNEMIASVSNDNTLHIWKHNEGV